MAQLINGLGGPNGFGEAFLPANDDGSTAAIDITPVFEEGVNFFGREFSSLFVNNNGSVTFQAPRSQYTPDVITENQGNPEITPFFADVDTRGGAVTPDGEGTSQGSNLVHYDLDTDGDRLVVTWDDVGYFGSNTDLTNAFQLVLTDQGGGDFDITFIYEDINWTTGDFSGGENGLGGEVARAGFTASVEEPGTEFELPASGDQAGILALDETEGNTGEIGIWEFSVRTGEVFPGGVPDLPDLAAWNWGDPHLVTLDGVGYDFQATGEYTLVEDANDPDGGFEVQARFVEAGPSVSVTEAVAVNIGGVDVMIDAASDTPLMVNGSVVDLGEQESHEISVDGDIVGGVYRALDGYRIVDAGEDGEVNDGDTQVSVSVFEDRLDVGVFLSDDMAGGVQGLLGDADGDPSNDIALLDGTVLDRPLVYTDLYGQYRTDWRVTSEEDSYFTYAEGESPDGFYDPEHPSELLSIDGFSDDEIAAAEAVLAEAGLEPGSLNYDAALLDYLATNDESFIDSAQGVDEVAAEANVAVDPETVAALTDVEQTSVEDDPGGTPTEETGSDEDDDDDDDDDDGDDDDSFLDGMGILLILGLVGAIAAFGMSGGMGL